MKTKTFLLLCLFLGIATTQLSAQNKSFVDRGVWVGYWIPAYCNGVQVDLLTGTASYHHIGHWHKGVWIWCHTQYSGEVKSELTDEVFKVKEIDITDIIQADIFQGIVYSHVNLIGNNGTHYIMTLIFDWGTGEVLSVESTVCL